MSSCLEYPWIKCAWLRLLGYLQQDKLPNALMIVGDSTLGGALLAETFTQSLLCMQRSDQGLACGECVPCKLLSTGNHPDYKLISKAPTSQGIGIDQIREISADLSLKPHFPGYRVVVVDDADSLTMPAFNAFLKILEEPPERTHFLLVSDSLNRLPVTIRSRCQKIWLVAPPKSVSISYLMNQGANDAELLLHINNYSPLSALAFYKENLLPVYFSTLDNWLDVIEHKIEWHELSERWLTGYKISLVQLFVWNSIWVSSLIKTKCNAEFEPGEIDQHHLSRFQSIAGTAELMDLFAVYDKLLMDIRLLSTSANPQLLLEELLLIYADNFRISSTFALDITA